MGRCATSIPITAFSMTRTLGANIDVTESYQRQLDLEVLSIRFGIATRAAKAGVWEWREGDDEVWWNDNMYAIYGFPAATFQPRLSIAVTMIHPDDLAVAEAAWAGALEQATDMHVQFRIIRADNSILHLDSVAAVVTDPHSPKRRLVGIILDITERVGTEQRERLLQKQLREASHRSGMAEVATGVLHNVGNVLNSLGVASSTVQARLSASHYDRVERVAALLEVHRDALGDFLVNDARGKHLPQYLSALGAQLKKDTEGLQREIDAISGHVQYLCDIVQAQQTFARVGGAEESVDVRELVDTALRLKARDFWPTATSCCRSWSISSATHAMRSRRMYRVPDRWRSARRSSTTSSKLQSRIRASAFLASYWRVSGNSASLPRRTVTALACTAARSRRNSSVAPSP
jgi:hypothetical protein